MGLVGCLVGKHPALHPALDAWQGSCVEHPLLLCPDEYQVAARLLTGALWQPWTSERSSDSPALLSADTTCLNFSTDALWVVSTELMEQTSSRA